ncbi:MAG: D-glycero-beta-D-manno-heptose-7-phosphate kinase [Vicinamibacterales bacterium]
MDDLVNRLPPLAADRARIIVDRMAGCHLLVLGDVMVDQFIVGRVSRISPEAPVPVVAFDRDEYRAGGAANVALNGRALGATVDLIGLVGADLAARRLVALLNASDVSAHALITDEKRPTTAKVRIVTTRNQQVARVDYETDDVAVEAIEDAVIRQVEARAPRAGAIVVSDYLKGIVTRRVMAGVVAAGQEHGIPVLVDPKIPHLDYYGGATLVTPNHHEAETATHLRIRSDEEARQAAAAFRERARCDGVLITRGEQGMWLACDGAEGHLPAAAREVSDVTGAGDTVVATLALAMAAGATVAEAAQLANEAAGIVVGKFGPATVTPTELLTVCSAGL